jgi:hypothetical protein
MVALALNPGLQYKSRKCFFFSICSLYTTSENVSISKELISIYYLILSLFSFTTKPKEPKKENPSESREEDSRSYVAPAPKTLVFALQNGTQSPVSPSHL